MNNELKKAIERLEIRHQVMKEYAAQDEGLKSEFSQGYLSGIAAANKQYGEEIEKVIQLLNGFMIDDVDLTGGEKHVS